MFFEINSISVINNDCLWCVFEHLSIKERIGLIRVNKQWQRVVRDLMEDGLETIKVWDFKCEENQIFHHRELLECDNKFFGGFQFESVNKIKIDYINGLTPKHLIWLFENLPNLNILKLPLMIVQEFDDQKLIDENLMKLTSKLTALKFDYWPGEESKFLECFLKSAVNLSKLKVCLGFSASDERLNLFLECLPPVIEKLTVDWINEEFLMKIIENLANLKHLQLYTLSFKGSSNQPSEIYNLKPEFFGYFSECLHLETIDLQFARVTSKRNLENRLDSPLWNLKKLCVDKFVVSASDFVKIVELIPNLSVLKLTNYRLNCDCQKKLEKGKKNNKNEGCQLCSARFGKAISNLANLTIFHSHTKLNCVEQIDPFIKELTELIKEDNFRRLQRLSLQHSDYSIPLIQALCFLAENCPMKSYHLELDVHNVLAYLQHYNDNGEIKKAFDEIRASFANKPRNLTFILLEK